MSISLNKPMQLLHDEVQAENAVDTHIEQHPFAKYIIATMRAQGRDDDAVVAAMGYPAQPDQARHQRALLRLRAVLNDAVLGLSQPVAGHDQKYSSQEFLSHLLSVLNIEASVAKPYLDDINEKVAALRLSYVLQANLDATAFLHRYSPKFAAGLILNKIRCVSLPHNIRFYSNEARDTLVQKLIAKHYLSWQDQLPPDVKIEGYRLRCVSNDGVVQQETLFPIPFDVKEPV